MAAAAEAGTVQILSQSRRIEAKVTPTLTGPDIVDAASAPDAGPFDADVMVEHSGDGFATSASVTVNSILGQDGLNYTGTASYDAVDTRPKEDDSGEIIALRVLFEYDVTFSIDAPYLYNFKADFQGSGNGSTSPSEGGFDFTGPDGFDANPGESGTIQPGEYRFVLFQSSEALAGATPTTLDIVYDFAIDLEPGGGGPGPGPNPIPLPPAVWSGLAVLGAGALLRFRRYLLA